ncbi:helix-turn-helix domain-containing protein [Halobaculum rubrum]|uniref:helix-turn-helix domain-containing protein n=1 Tax=Halobaculum rubrum TaxID=2872158 RepID=UPI001CA3CEAF|nr:helix-turn-helix domain-containing protein [Halobaculum rubrum]QZY00384.1 helix-turn-helix domain-containing protein [Halobaculum rubrum]
MKTLALRLDPDEASTHPMHAFVADHPEFGPTRLLQWNPRIGETNVLLFHIDGPPEPFLPALDGVDTTEVVEPSAESTVDGFYLYVRERLTERDRGLVEAFADENVVVVPPVVYDTDGSMRFSVVGTGDALGRAIDRIPDGVDVSVRRVRSGAGAAVAPGGGLTDRQREVVAAAVDAGYYEEPRGATVADVAERLDCAPSTAAEHIRRAEATLVRGAVDDR